MSSFNIIIVMMFIIIIILALSILVSAEPFKSPFITFCKYRLGSNDFTAVGIYHKHLETTEAGKRLIQLYYDSITTDDKNRHRNGGFKVKQDDDHRMKEIDNIIRKDLEVRQFRSDLRQRSQLGFSCVDEFEMQASGRALVEDIETGRARRPNMKVLGDFHNVLSGIDLVETGGFDAFGNPIPADLPHDNEDDDSEESRSRSFSHLNNNNKDGNNRGIANDDEDSLTEDKKDSHRLTRTEQMTKSLEERRAREGDHHRQRQQPVATMTGSGSGSNTYSAQHLHKHATEHFRRHEEAKRAHRQYQEQLINQRKASVQDSKRQPSDIIHQQHLRTMQQQQEDLADTKNTFDHMQSHFKQHHDHVEAAQRRRIQDASEQTKKLHEDQIREMNRNVAHEKLGLYDKADKKRQQQQQQQKERDQQHQQQNQKDQKDQQNVEGKKNAEFEREIDEFEASATSEFVHRQPAGARPKHARIPEHRQSKFREEESAPLSSVNIINKQQQQSTEDPPRRLRDDKRNGGPEVFKAHLHADPLNHGGYEKVMGKAEVKKRG